jgi:hypothetical protein
MYKLEMQIIGGGLITIETFDFKKICKIEEIVRSIEEKEFPLAIRDTLPCAPKKRRGRPPGAKNK